MRGASGAATGLAAAVLTCVAAVLLASGLGPVTVTGDSPLDRWRPAGGSTAEQAAEPVDDAAVDTVEPGEPVLGIPVEVVLAMVVAVVAAALLVRSVLRARRPPDDEHDLDEDPDAAADALEGAGVDLEAVAAAARRGLLRLDAVSGADATEVVMACWVELEVAGSRLGSGRTATDTPTEFAARLAAAVPGLDPDMLADLRSTYSRVRYGSGGASAQDVERCRAALAHLLDSLGPGDAPGPGDTHGPGAARGPGAAALTTHRGTR